VPARLEELGRKSGNDNNERLQKVTKKGKIPRAGRRSCATPAFMHARAAALIVVCGGLADAGRPERQDDAREIE
jgi:hypothetical protein